jgi:hypothetical protein
MQYVNRCYKICYYYLHILYALINLLGPIHFVINNHFGIICVLKRFTPGNNTL